MRRLPRRHRRNDRQHLLVAAKAAKAARDECRALARFFDEEGRPSPAEIARLHADIGTLLLPSAERTIDLDRAYQAIVREQGFVRGRDAVLAAASHVYARAPVGDRTGIDKAVGPP